MSRSQFKAEQCEIVKTFGVRMKEARELCNMSQLAAAKKLGYANSSKLAKIEHATDTNSVPLWLIRRAAKLYDVSVDFLFGMSEDWERDPKVAQERDVYRWVREEMEAELAHSINERRALKNQITTLEAAIADIAPAVEQCQAAVVRFQEINPEFQDMRGGSMVVASIEQAGKVTRGATAAMRRYKVKFSVVGATPDPEMLKEALKELAALSPLEYEQVRKDRAARLGVRASVLDQQVDIARRLFGRTGQLKLFAE